MGRNTSVLKSSDRNKYLKYYSTVKERIHELHERQSEAKRYKDMVSYYECEKMLETNYSFYSHFMDNFQDKLGMK